MLSSALLEKCYSGELTMREIETEYIANTPNVPYAFIQSKTDIVQESFYVAIAVTNNATAKITPSQFYSGVNSIFGSYNTYPNFVAFLVDGITDKIALHIVLFKHFFLALSHTTSQILKL